MKTCILLTIVFTCFPAEELPKSTLNISYETVITVDPISGQTSAAEQYHSIE